MKVLVLGGAGQVARAVLAASPNRHQVIAKARGELDIADAHAVSRLLTEMRPDWVVNAAAYTAVDLAEDNPVQAREVNDKAVGVLTQASVRMGCRLLQLSTDFVFDGKSNLAYMPYDSTGPLNVYGESKLAGERQVLDQLSTGIILRTSWVYASSGRNFVLTMLRLMRENCRLNVVCDQIGSPTWAAGLATAIWGLIDAGTPGGIYHWTDLGVTSWYDFAIAIQDEALTLGLLMRPIRIVPVSSANYPTRAPRPPFSVLNTELTRATLNLPGTHWRHCLRMMLNELRAP